MNRWEKQVQHSLLKDEQRILRILQLMYTDVLREIEERIAGYYTRLSANPADAAAVYQLRYQQALAEQLDKILEGFAEKNYTTIQSYLEDCYTNGFVGTVYDIRKQGVPVMLPIQQENVVRAITLDSQISIPMYTRLGNNIALLKTAIAAEVTRGIASGTSWHDTAAHIVRQGRVSAYNAMRIARTEGHRIACAAQMDACQAAAEVGADIVKQWDSTLDDRTRQHHRDLHGQIRELDKPFEVAGLKAQYPGVFGRPEEDIHCRCCLLQRARWALSEEERKRLRGQSSAAELDGAIEFKAFKEKYLEMLDKSGENDIIEVGSDAMFRKSRDGKIEPMPKKQFQRITKRFKAQGGLIQSNDETDEYLKSKNAEAITYNESTILIRQNPGRASVFEELIHTAQYRNGRNDGSYASRLRCEIEAQEKLLRNAKAYKLTEPEIYQTQKALEAYQKELYEYLKNGGE